MVVVRSAIVDILQVCVAQPRAGNVDFRRGVVAQPNRGCCRANDRIYWGRCQRACSRKPSEVIRYEIG